MYNLTDLTLDHVFHTNIIAYCQQNQYIRLAIYTGLFTLITYSQYSIELLQHLNHCIVRRHQNAILKLRF